MGCAAAAGNSSTLKATNGGLPVPYTSPVTPLYHTPPVWTGFIVGYYINPGTTPLSQINFTDLKSAGITDVYVLVRNDNYLTILPDAKAKADAVGIKTHAWVFPGFAHASQVADMKIGVQLDMETYDMPKNLSLIKQMRQDTQGVTFSISTKPDRWDDNQYYYMIAPYCDYIVPMLYIGDYNQSITSLKNWATVYNVLLPGKIVIGLQTYDSYQNVTPLSKKTLLAEIKSVQPYCRGVILFRYGLSNFIDS